MSLEATGISVTLGGKAILGGASFSAPRSAVTGLIGPNGAGKSTLLRALLGLVAATGTVRLDAADLPALPRRERARLAAFVEQTASTEERLTVREVVGLGRIPFEAAWQSEPSDSEKAIVDAALADTGMSGFALRRFDTLSGGEQQRVHVARALAQQPRLLLLDEPTSHLDIRAQLKLLALLRRKSAAGMCVILAIHDLNLAARFCDHLVVLDGGKVIIEGTPHAVLTSSLLLDVYGVHARVLPGEGDGGPTIILDAAAPPNPD